jgi:hypothetical protein
MALCRIDKRHNALYVYGVIKLGAILGTCLMFSLECAPTKPARSIKVKGAATESVAATALSTATLDLSAIRKRDSVQVVEKVYLPTKHDSEYPLKVSPQLAPRTLYKDGMHNENGLGKYTSY